MSKRVEQLKKIHQESLDVFIRKNKDYGDAFSKYGVVGVIVRIGDKINRLMSVSKNGVALVDDETLNDTLLDLHNYAAMALMLRKE